MTFQVPCDGWHLEQREMEESTYLFLVRWATAWYKGLTDKLRLEATVATLKHTEIRGERHNQRGGKYRPHAICRTLIFLPLAEARRTQEGEREGEAEMVLTARKKNVGKKRLNLCRALLSGASLQTAVGLRAYIHTSQRSSTNKDWLMCCLTSSDKSCTWTQCKDYSW